MNNREELQKQAHEKLTEAWKLIREAGALAKEGQFYLHFGEVGEFIPSSFDDRSKLREQAMEELKQKGRHNGYDTVPNEALTKQYGSQMFDYVEKPYTPYDQLTEDEIETALESIVDGIIDGSEVSYEGREYGSRDRWWHPSRC